MRFLYSLAERYYGEIRIRVEAFRIDLVFPELSFNDCLSQLILNVIKPEKLFFAGCVYPHAFAGLPSMLKVQIHHEAFSSEEWSAWEGYYGRGVCFIANVGKITLPYIISAVERERVFRGGIH